ncbi:MAG: hypothetical protein R3324_01100, partial [Halobacteriales archaeon]|nr:hypothetical protein [Halobacteriales archaeon]
GYFWPVVYQACFETPESNDPKPILTNPIGGSAERSQRVDAGGGRTPLRGVDPVNPARFDETSALILVPISVLALVSLVLGVVPGAGHVMALVEAVVTVATGGGI